MKLNGQNKNKKLYLKFKKQKHNEDTPMWWADRVLPTDKNAWYEKVEDDD